MPEGEVDPLSGIQILPDLLVLRVNGQSMEELEALAHYKPEERPPTIVIGEASNPECMRFAMRAGARDFLTEPVSEKDFLASVARLAAETRAAKSSERSQLIAFINAKGGSGATFLACNIAHLFACVSEFDTALLDLDLQFGTLPEYLDIHPRRGLLDALDVADDLDGVAIDAYMTKHTSGLSVLAGLRDSAMLQQDLMLARFETVLNLLSGNFERIVVDLPRRIEPFSAMVLERADRVVLVMQQSVPSLHDAVRMNDILTRELAIPADHITVAVNRYVKSASVEISDIQSSLNDKVPVRIPNDFKVVTESVNMGIPLREHARRAAITKALMRLEEGLGGRSAGQPKGFMTRLRGAG
jgi:pilus assembly protein CpaE